MVTIKTYRCLNRSLQICNKYICMYIYTYLGPIMMYPPSWRLFSLPWDFHLIMNDVNVVSRPFIGVLFTISFHDHTDASRCFSLQYTYLWFDNGGGGGQDNHKLPEEHLERTWIDPLVGGGVESGDNRLGWSERRKYPPALNLAREQEIYEASLCAYNTMLLVWNRIVGSGWVPM